MYLNHVHTHLDVNFACIYNFWWLKHPFLLVQKLGAKPGKFGFFGIGKKNLICLHSGTKNKARLPRN